MPPPSIKPLGKFLLCAISPRGLDRGLTVAMSLVSKMGSTPSGCRGIAANVWCRFAKTIGNPILLILPCLIQIWKNWPRKVLKMPKNDLK